MKIFSNVLVLFKKVAKKQSAPRLIFQHGYDYKFQFQGTIVQLSVSMPVRNYETFLRDKDTLSHCECGTELKTKNVSFGLNGSGKTIFRPVQYCPKCDEAPMDYTHLCAAINNQLIFV